METTERRERLMQPDTLAASVAILLVANLVQRSVGFGRGVLFCRWLSPDELGAWEMAYSFLLLAAPVIVLGLPGSFGRYLERFRQRGQLRTFLRRATIWTASLTFAAIALIVLAAPQYSEFIFGRPDERTMVLLLAASLIAVISHHFLEALFAALRKFSIVSAMHFSQSILFATISLALLWMWRFSAESIVIGYGAACLVSVLVTLAWKYGALSDELVPDGGVAHREFWPPLVRFAVWVWVSNLLCHMFGVIDRYMLLHWSGLDSDAALAMVGHYHASRIVPLLFLSVADLLSGAVLPHLSHDWELGQRQQVSDRLNLILKMASLVMLAGGSVVLWFAPLLFHVAFEGRYNAGLAVMPWTLTYCVWYGLLLVAQTYIWCAERMKLGTLPLTAGLVVNVVLNLALIPTLGLRGAVLATTTSTAVALVVMFSINWRAGMQLRSGTLLLTAAPLALASGPWTASLTVVVICLMLPFSRVILTDSERTAIVNMWLSFFAKVAAHWSPRVDRGETSHAI